MEALQKGEPVQKIYLHFTDASPLNERIVRLARKRRIAVGKIDKAKFRQILGNVNHQGVAALISPIPVLNLDELLETVRKKTELPSLVLLDSITDPHNMGAIIRSAEVLGADGLIFSLQENVPLTDTVVKTSAGAIFHLPVCQVSNLRRASEQLKESGIWIYGSDPSATVPLWTVDFRRPFCVIIGNEEKGMRPLLRKVCDQLFRIPQMGKIQSLNASVATGIVLAESLRQRSVSR